MASPRDIARIVIAVTIAGVLITPMVTAVDSNTGQVDVTNETVTADVGNYTQLDGYDVVADSETVINSNGATMTAGTDYEIAEDNGSIKALSGGNISDGSEIDVSYTYQATDGQATTIANQIPLFMGLLILGVMAGYMMKNM